MIAPGARDADVQSALRALHAEVDAEAARLADRLGPALRCGLGCTACCVDEVTVFEVEAARILEAEGLAGQPAPPGRCAFLAASGACRVYGDRPYVCRTQGLPLRWLDEDAGETVERRDICELEDEGVDLLGLDPGECWTLGPFEGRLATLQARVDGGALRRVSLREVAEELYSRTAEPTV